MKRMPTLSMLMLLSLILAACGGATQPAGDTQPTAAPPAAAEQPPTATQPASGEKVVLTMWT